MDFKANYNFKSGSVKKVNEYIRDNRNYDTTVMYTKSLEGNTEVIKGAFVSKNKTPVKNLKDLEKEMNTIYYDHNSNYTMENEKIGISLKTIFIFGVLVIFLVDFFKFYQVVKSENNIERLKCEEEFKLNECDKVTLQDGPKLNDYCKEREKCVKIRYGNVWAHRIMIKYAEDIIVHSFGNISFINTILFIFAGYLVTKLIMTNKWN